MTSAVPHGERGFAVRGSPPEEEPPLLPLDPDEDEPLELPAARVLDEPVPTELRGCAVVPLVAPSSV